MNFFKQMLEYDKELAIFRTRDRIFAFAKESNMIEGITRQGANSDHASRLETFLGLDSLTTADVIIFNTAGVLRTQAGMYVRVGTHTPPDPGQHILYKLESIVISANDGADPYPLHNMFETLHPFTDGNGRTGRAIWLWQMVNQYKYNMKLSFLHKWYYQSLENNR